MESSASMDLVVILWKASAPMDLIVVLWRNLFFFFTIDLIVVLWKFLPPWTWLLSYGEFLLAWTWLLSYGLSRERRPIDLVVSCVCLV